MANSKKAPFQLGHHTTQTFKPGTLVPEPKWFNVAQFRQRQQRAEQATFLEKLEVTSVFCRTESGHSTPVDVKHPAFKSSECMHRYLVHGTYEANWPSIQSTGLKPGGTQDGRQHVHFVLDHHMTKTLDSVRKEGDCLIVLKQMPLMT